MLGSCFFCKFSTERFPLPLILIVVAAAVIIRIHLYCVFTFELALSSFCFSILMLQMLDYCIWIEDNFGHVLWPYAMVYIILIHSCGVSCHRCKAFSISSKCCCRPNWSTPHNIAYGIQQWAQCTACVRLIAGNTKISYVHTTRTSIVCIQHGKCCNTTKTSQDIANSNIPSVFVSVLLCEWHGIRSKSSLGNMHIFVDEAVDFCWDDLMDCSVFFYLFQKTKLKKYIYILYTVDWTKSF